MSALHVATPDARVRYRVEESATGWTVTRCRHDGVRWLAQLHYRVATRTKGAALRAARTLAAREGSGR